MMQNILGNNFRKFFGISLTALLLFGGFFVANNVSSIALPGPVLIFEDLFEQSGSSLGSNSWDNPLDASDANRDDESDDGFEPGLSGTKGLLLEGDDNSVASYTLDDGAEVVLENETLETDTSHESVSFTIDNPNRNTKLTLRFVINGTSEVDEVGIDEVRVYGSDEPLFYDGFESGGFSTGEWITTDGDDDSGTNLPTIEHEDGNDDTMWTDDNNTDTGHSTGSHATNGHASKIEGNGDTNPDEIIDKLFNSTGYENIYIRYAIRVNNLEPVNPSQDTFSAQYSIDGGSIWNDLEIPLHDDQNYTSVISGPLSGADNNPDLKFRFIIDADNTNDEVYLDDVVIWGTPLTTGSITINKTTVGGDGTFSFTRTGSEEITQITTETLSGSATINNLEPGDYTITETEQEGWSTENNTCVVTVSSGNTETCSFTNTKLSTITGFKFEDTNGNGAWEEGELGVANWPMFLGKVGQRLIPEQPAGPGNEIPIEIVALELTGSSPIGQVQFDNLQPGNYKIFEEQQTAWAPTTPQIDSFFYITYQIDWQGIAQAPFIESFFYLFVVLPGQVLNQGTPSCGQESCPLSPIAFGNFHNITITVEKDVVNPQGEVVEDNHNFSLRLDEINGETITQGTVYTFSENNAKVYTNIGLGTYKISETNGEITGDPDFDLLAISNDNDADPTNGYTFNVESGQDITITITNQQKQGSLTVRKVVT